MAGDDYDKEILRERGYIVELSNRGDLIKHNPNFYNPEKKKLKCVAVWEQNPQTKIWEPITCDKLTLSAYRLCPRHNKLGSYPKHKKDWLGRVILPGKTREDCKTWALPHPTITLLLIRWIGGNREKGIIADGFIDDILASLHKRIPDATTLQEVYTGELRDEMQPDEFAGITLKLVDKHFPKDRFGDEIIDASDLSFKGFTIGNIPLRVVAASQVLAFCCEEANRGDAHGCAVLGLEPRYANMFMPLSLYLLMRKGATLSEARMCSK
jgi:hypothetical protein